jgi:predicted glycogen debranching enzyme
MRTVRRLSHPREHRTSEAGLEWLVTNGLGGYASSALSGAMTRRYHGILVAALPAPVGRMVMLSHVRAGLRAADGSFLPFEPGLPTRGGPDEHRLASLVEFRLEDGLPVWLYDADGVTLEKRILMPHRQNTVHVTYRALDPTRPVRLELRPFMHFRHYESSLSDAPVEPYVLTAVGGRIDIHAGGNLPPLRLSIHGCRSALTLDGTEALHPYLEERRRGYLCDGHIWSPGYFHLDLDPHAGDVEGTLLASTESWETIDALTPAEAASAEARRRDELIEQAQPAARHGLAAELVLAADQFIITPVGRSEDAARAIALGTEARTVIAGYHWFTDWGRDTMISLEGLSVATGRLREAGLILRTFAHYVRDGLIPNMFPDGECDGLYHTADATLWFFHAIDRYLKASGDDALLHTLLPTLRDIIAKHIEGTRFGIGVDPADGLLRQGADGYQLTWMDAKVDDWVVTPRRGKAVEINALFYNALRLVEGWVRGAEGDAAAATIQAQADRTRKSFNARFWNAADSYLYDVVDGESGDDAACRPNQILAISLTHPVLERERWPAVLETVREKLLTPCGLRSLAPGQPEYKPRYYGDLRARDAAYHQGTVWAWLIGPFVDAWRRVSPDDEPEIQNMLQQFDSQLNEAGVGQISEIFDADPPFTPRGCIAQAWSVAEVLRVLTA